MFKKLLERFDRWLESDEPSLAQKRRQVMLFEMEVDRAQGISRDVSYYERMARSAVPDPDRKN